MAKARDKLEGRSRFALAASLVLLVLLGATGFWIARPDTALLDEARQQERQQNYPAAIELYSQILSNEPRNVEANRNLAVLLFLRGSYSEALPYQERVVELDDKDVQTRLELGFNYLNHQGRAEDALRVLQEAAALEPSARNLTFVAQAQKTLGLAESSVATLRTAIAADASYPYAYRLLQAVLESSGRREESNKLVAEAASHGVYLAAAN